MRAVVQRVSECSIRVSGNIVAETGSGLLVYLGVGATDSEDSADYLIGKIPKLRIFNDEHGAMNLSAVEKSCAICVVSQFTLYGDTRKGRRPSYSAAAPPERARGLYDYFVAELVKSGLEIASGIFGEHMEVGYINDGPITILLDSEKLI